MFTYPPVFMAAITPRALFPNYAILAAGAVAPSAGIFIPLADLTGLTEAEAGTDGRKVLFGICRTAQANFAALPTEARPARLTLTKSTPTGLTATTIRQAYTVTVDLDFNDADVAPEA